MNHLLLVDTFSKVYYFILVDSDTTTDLSAVYIESATDAFTVKLSIKCVRK